MHKLKRKITTVPGLLVVVTTPLLLAVPIYFAQKFVPVVQAGSIYTCTDTNGTKTFSDRPCKSPSKAADQQSSPAQRSKHVPKQSSSTQPKQSNSTQPKQKAGGNYGHFIDRARAIGDEFEN